jgi:RNA polymerase sigma-70 factor (ECF subfamily)
MSISEGRQCAQRPNPFQHQPPDIPSPSLAPTRATAILPKCSGKSRKPLPGQSDAANHGKLVYAVHNVTDSEQTVSDEMLLKSVAEGDKAAMHILFARHRTRVLRFIQRTVRNPGIAEDLVSQVFLDVWRSANRFESRARVSTWLLSIARFKAINSLRERTCENIDQDDVRGIVDAGDTPEEALDRKETKGILLACINKLSPAHREIIDLIYYREKSVGEVSEIVRVPYATAKSRIFYARKQLSRILVNAGFEAAAARTNLGKSAARSSRLLHPNMRATASVNPECT